MTLKGIGKALLEVDSENENLNSRKSASYFPTDYDPIGVIIVGNLQSFSYFIADSRNLALLSSALPLKSVSRYKVKSGAKSTFERMMKCKIFRKFDFSWHPEMAAFAAMRSLLRPFQGKIRRKKHF